MSAPESKVGLIVVNLGTPARPDARAVREYLAEFLSDPRVVEIPAALWQPILRAIVLRTRPARSAHAYRQVWTDEGSPLAVITRRQAEKLADRLGEAVIVDHAMRYGRPAIGERIDALMERGCTRILATPLYPQYCGATTASAQDRIFAHLASLRRQPAIRTLPSYHDDPAYVDALAARVGESLAALDFEPETIVASFHGMPERTARLGDPYYRQCLETARLVGEALGRELVVGFQSRFGRDRWLEPATDRLLAELAGTGTRRIAIFAPGFSADCLETLEELGIRGRETFLAAGGEHFALLPCLNDSPMGMDMLETLVRRELEGWVKRP